MEKKEEIVEIVKHLIRRSEGKLTSAKILLERDRIDDAISRAYYAAFLSVRALLYLLGISTRTHTGVITMFGLRVIKEGLLPSKIGMLNSAKSFSLKFENNSFVFCLSAVIRSRSISLRGVYSSRAIDPKTIILIKFLSIFGYSVEIFCNTLSL